MYLDSRKTLLNCKDMGQRSKSQDRIFGYFNNAT